MALLDFWTAGASIDHGGNLDRARALFPHAPEPWVDLSTGINPHSYPLFDLPTTALSRLPEPARMRELAAMAAAVYGARSADLVVPAPGTQILLPRIYSLVKPGNAAVLGPTYAEHRLTAALCGHHVVETADFDRLSAADLAIIVNPNNPDGRVVPREGLLELGRTLHRKGGLLVVDEAFMDIGPRDQSVAGDVGAGGLIVLRSFGKFFGLAGLRLGFAVAPQNLAERLAAELGPWAVAGPALEYGLRALADTAWQDGMRGRLAEDAARLDALLGRFGIVVDGGTSLFRHLTSSDAPDLFASLGGKGILLRRFSDRPAELRVGLPGTGEEWHRLEAALTEWSFGKDRARLAGGLR